MSLAVDGRDVRVSSLDRVLWPRTGHTKADLIRYTIEVGPLVLPHVADHPATLHRFPEGVGGPHFFQTRAPSHPDWIRAVTLETPREHKVFDVIVLDDLAGLVWAANITTIELHPYLGTTTAFDRPGVVVFDLDPGPPADLVTCCTVALALRDHLEELRLRSWPKVSGGKGLHVHVPVDHEASFDQTKAFARAVAARLAEAHPETVVTNMAKRLRTGRVLVDWSQNDPWKSIVAPYSPRGLTYPTVAAPVTWDEVARVAATGDLRPLLFLIDDIAARLDRVGDLFADLPSSAQPLPELG